MTVMKKTEQKDDAVSPVVGVMLMLVVTIIIAAVVAAFASGVTADVEKAPNAVLDVKIYEKCTTTSAGDKYVYPSIQIKSIGGEPISTEDMVLKFSWNANGEDYTCSYVGGETYVISDTTYPVMGLISTDFSEYLPSTYSLWYGNVTISPGDVLQSTGLFEAYDAAGNSVSLDTCKTFNLLFNENQETVKSGQKMHVVIMWNNYAIFDKEVIVL